MYSDAARARRRCTARRKDGQLCQAWAMWEDDQQRCVRHARGGRGMQHMEWRAWHATRYEPCTCVAYNWPHRPGGGLCRWPDPPHYRLTTPAGTHSWLRVRRPKWWPRLR